MLWGCYTIGRCTATASSIVAWLRLWCALWPTSHAQATTCSHPASETQNWPRTWTRTQTLVIPPKELSCWDKMLPCTACTGLTLHTWLTSTIWEPDPFLGFGNSQALKDSHYFTWKAILLEWERLVDQGRQTHCCTHRLACKEGDTYTQTCKHKII